MEINKQIEVQGVVIILKVSKKSDYICITDIAKARGDGAKAADIIKNWIRNCILDMKKEIQYGRILFYFKYDIFGSNICILERIEIIPRFRGYNLAAKAIKDIVFHFSSNCALFVIQAYPLQFEAERSEQSKWQKQLELTLFPTNEKHAVKKFCNRTK
ncbi:MAG: hypothetical protein ACOC2M_05335 [bacterium]